jgi:hypothetical protein
MRGEGSRVEVVGDHRGVAGVVRRRQGIHGRRRGSTPTLGQIEADGAG